MLNFRIVLGSVLGVLSIGSLNAEVSNWWPFLTTGDADDYGRPASTTLMGPLFECKDSPEADILSLRPFWTQFDIDHSDDAHYHLLYPLANYYDYGDHWHWHSFNLIRGSENEHTGESSLEVIPFYFSQQTGDPETSYRALWPLYGTLKSFFGRDRIDFALWPLYIRTQKADEVRFSTPWPFVQTLTGPESSGFGLWPFYGHFQRNNDYDHTWAAWPLYYDLTDRLDQPSPYERFGVLPFYTRERGDGLISKTFAWPFFGYTRESEPRPKYRENRYFWPFLVQGRGEEQYKNRWMPFYTHERKGNAEKWWYLWPILKRETSQLGYIERQRTQVLYFLYRDDLQRGADGFSARRTYLWPFWGYADNGQGHTQWQLFDPLGVFFPRNEKVRENWSPLFSIYRYDARPDSVRHSALWNLFVLENDTDGSDALYLGPLFEKVDRGADGHWQILKGLIGRENYSQEKRWIFFWNAF